MTEASQVLVWIHADSLSVADPAMIANGNAPAVFIFDDALLSKHGFSHQRLVFLYESAVEIAAQNPLFEIHHGHVCETLRSLALTFGATEIHTTSGIAPLQAKTLSLLEKDFSIRLHEPEKFVTYKGPTPKRFMNFWYKIEKDAMRFDR
ncbi:MAG: hypothetical protein IAF08_13355 [Rhizobacter sp.]|nr:hypothetical protein [Chlorobiales bacterium]